MAVIDEIVAAYIKKLRDSTDYKQHVEHVKAKAQYLSVEAKLSNLNPRRTVGMSEKGTHRAVASYPQEAVFAIQRAYPQMGEKEMAAYLGKVLPECVFSTHQ